nr:MAG TPA: hypothetical protein [Caudoviricetes sp.]
MGENRARRFNRLISLLRKAAAAASCRSLRSRNRSRSFRREKRCCSLNLSCLTLNALPLTQ